MLTDEAYLELQEALGPENVSQEPGVLDGYAWQPLWNHGPDMWVHRPVAVALPGSTEDVQAVVRTCNKHGLKFKALSSGWGAIAGPGCDDVVQIDLRRMDRILEIDEKNMYAVVEPCAIGGMIRAEVMKRGLNVHMISAGAVSSPLASATSAWGCCWDGIVAGWSPRTVLGVEWVLPDGEVLKLGTPGSEMGWFCGDGPGPSLRGIMRGRCGTFSGNGVFTKCALKLFHWPGPATQEGDGFLFDTELTNMPDRVKAYWLFFPDEKHFRDATLSIAMEGIGYAATKLAIGTGFTVLFPHLIKNQSWGKVESIRNLFRCIRLGFLVVMGANSQGEKEFQEAVMRKAVADHGGFLIDMDHLRIGSGVSWSLISGGMPPVAFRAGGMFNIGWGQDEAHDAMVTAKETAGTPIKLEWIEKGAALDDLGDSAFHFFCEEGIISHYEECWWYDHRDRQMTEAIWPMEIDFTTMHIERCMESGLDCDPYVRKIYSPLQGHYNEWQKKIREAFDPNEAGDPTFYTAEEELDLSGIPEAKREKLERLIAARTWTQDGPPA